MNKLFFQWKRNLAHFSWYLAYLLVVLLVPQMHDCEMRELTHFVVFIISIESGITAEI